VNRVGKKSEKHKFFQFHSYKIWMLIRIPNLDPDPGEFVQLGS
jgi:hypothetical protein